MWRALYVRSSVECSTCLETLPIEGKFKMLI